jgi:hypothetical protein
VGAAGVVEVVEVAVDAHAPSSSAAAGSASQRAARARAAKARATGRDAREVILESFMEK